MSKKYRNILIMVITIWIIGFIVIMSCIYLKNKNNDDLNEIDKSILIGTNTDYQPDKESNLLNNEENVLEDNIIENTQEQKEITEKANQTKVEQEVVKETNPTEIKEELTKQTNIPSINENKEQEVINEEQESEEKEEVDNSSQNNNNQIVEEVKPEPERCTNSTNHAIEVGNSNKWFNTKEEAIADYDSKIKYWGEKWTNFEIDDDTYYDNCPSGYEVYSCAYCGKWTINYYYR